MRAMGMRPMIPERSGVVGMAAELTSRWISTLPSGSLHLDNSGSCVLSWAPVSFGPSGPRPH